MFMAKKKQPSPDEAASLAGLDAALPEIETWTNRFPGYEVTIVYPEFTSVCPKSGLPDCGSITVRYVPGKHCLELKSFKMYLLAYRNLGIFYENAVNRIARDIQSAARPVSLRVTGDFRPRGGMLTTVEVSFEARPTGKPRPGGRG